MMRGKCTFPLGALAYTRSGDKGNSANIGKVKRLQLHNQNREKKDTNCGCWLLLYTSNDLGFLDHFQSFILFDAYDIFPYVSILICVSSIWFIPSQSFLS